MSEAKEYKLLETDDTGELKIISLPVPVKLAAILLMMLILRVVWIWSRRCCCRQERDIYKKTQ